MKKVRRILINPVVVIVPIVSLFLFGWQQYAVAQPLPSNTTNNVMPNAGFDELDGSGKITGWQVSPANANVQMVSLQGYDSPKSLLVKNSSSQSGNVRLASPTAGVQSGKRYLYKGYYKSAVPFDLILRSNYKDGSNTQMIVNHYVPSESWATVAHAFIAEPGVQSVQVIYSFAAVGSLQLDNSYLTPDPDDVYIAPEPAKVSNNLIPNASLAGAKGTSPDSWSGYTVGNNHADFSYVTDSTPAYLRAQVDEYKGGEAKWQYKPVAVRPGQYFQFNVSYLSDRPADVVVEYTLGSGERKFKTLTTLLAASDWTNYTGRFEAPADAKDAFVALILRGNGTLSTANYSLYDISKSGAPSWQHPLVSFTFDDGWETAYTNGARLLDQYSYKGTFYLNPSSIETADFMSSSQVESLHNTGHELASHGHEHLDFRTLNKQLVDYQLGHAAAYFNQAFGNNPINFATPFGGSDPEVQYYARKYYASHRGTESGINTRQNLDPYNLVIFYIGNDTPLARVKDVLAEAKATNGWVVLVYHRISNDGNSDTTIAPANFQQHVEAVRQSGITVKTVAAALQETSHE